MNTKYLVALILVAGITANVYAVPDKPPPEPQDVNVVNTPNVTVTNPQTSVTVDNAAGNPVPVTVQNQSSGCSESQFVGFTTDTFNGGQGVVTYTNSCQVDYPGSHMCTSEEFLNSSSYPATSGYAWIKPTYTPVILSYGGTSLYTIVQDISGVSRITSSQASQVGIACSGWNLSTGGRGLRVDGMGRFDIQPCDELQSIACCASAS